MEIAFENGAYTDGTGRTMLDPTVYQDWQIGAAAERALPPVEEFRRRVVERIDATKLLKTEYLSVVHAETLEEIDTWSDSFPMRCCIAVQAGDIRLIDNIAIA